MSNASTLEAEDRPRLKRQLEHVRDYMLSMNVWRTLQDIEFFLGYPQASISARLRQLRSQGFTVERQRKGGRGGTWQYRVRAKTGAGEQQQLFATNSLTPNTTSV